jgi:hypothetical protein
MRVRVARAPPVRARMMAVDAAAGMAWKTVTGGMSRVLGMAVQIARYLSELSLVLGVGVLLFRLARYSGLSFARLPFRRLPELPPSIARWLPFAPQAPASSASNAARGGKSEKSDAAAQAESRFLELSGTLMLSAPFHVNRTASALQALQGYLNSSTTGSIAVLTGGSGCGKSTAARMALNARDGVVPVTLGASVSVGTLSSPLLRRLGLADDVSTGSEWLPFLRASAAFRRATNPSESQWLPCCYMHVTGGASLPVLRTAFSVLEELVNEHAAARAVVVLADPNDIYRLLPAGADPNGQTVLWLSDWSRAEAVSYLDDRKALVPGSSAGAGELREALLESVGTRAQTLVSLCRLLQTLSGSEAEAAARGFIDGRVRAARLSVQYLLASAAAEGPGAIDVRGLMQLLLKRCAEAEGAARADGGAEDGLVECEAVAFPPSQLIELLSRPEHNCLVYDGSRRGYRFNTRAHRCAAARLFAPPPPPPSRAPAEPYARTLRPEADSVRPPAAEGEQADDRAR